jgi:hypothetical protein
MNDPEPSQGHGAAIRFAHHKRGWRDWYQLQSWRNRAKAQLREHPLCAICLAESRITPAVLADHVQSHHGDWNKFRLGKLQSLCSRCHNSRKRLEETLGFSSAIGRDGWPIDPRHPANRA